MHYVEGKPIFESTIMGPTLQKHALAAFYKHRFFIQWLILKKWKKCTTLEWRYTSGKESMINQRESWVCLYYYSSAWLLDHSL